VGEHCTSSLLVGGYFTLLLYQAYVQDFLYIQDLHLSEQQQYDTQGVRFSRYSLPYIYFLFGTKQRISFVYIALDN